MIGFLYSDHSATVNYVKWQLLLNEYNNFATLFLSDGVKTIHKIEFPLAETTNQACAQVVEKFIPFAIARPFVKEFINEEVIHQV